MKEKKMTGEEEEEEVSAVYNLFEVSLLVWSSFCLREMTGWPKDREAAALLARRRNTVEAAPRSLLLSQSPYTVRSPQSELASAQIGKAPGDGCRGWSPT
ncbi:hypothetical protein TWF281_007230 [Arthrobotrys megalospora]